MPCVHPELVCPDFCWWINNDSSCEWVSPSFCSWTLDVGKCADATSIGAVYGRNGDNIPPPLTAAELMHQYTITRVRIYDHDVNVIQAFATTQIRVMIAVTNDEIPGVAGTQSVADNWVSVNVAPYIKTVNINAIAVGSEVLTSTNLSAQLVPAMTNIHTALTKQGFDQSVKVSSPHGLGLLEISYPPSSGVFFATYVGVLQPMLDFLAQTGSFFMLNAYPFRAYESNIIAVDLNYALFNTSTGVRDTNTNLQYYSLYDAQIDALVSAISLLNHSTLPIVVTETGWPSQGDASEPAANYQDADTYNTNLVANTLNNSGTPLRPGQEIDAYIVSLYDEDLNPLPVSNQHWGLFYVNGTSKYGIDFATANWNTGGNNGSSNSSSNSTAPPPPPASGGTPSSPSSSNVWCVAKPGSTNASLQQVNAVVWCLLSAAQIRACLLLGLFRWATHLILCCSSAPPCPPPDVQYQDCCSRGLSCKVVCFLVPNAIKRMLTASS